MDETSAKAIVMGWLLRFELLCPHGHEMKIVERRIKGDETTVCFECPACQSYASKDDEYNSLILRTSMNVWFEDRQTGKEYECQEVTSRKERD